MSTATPLQSRTMPSRITLVGKKEIAERLEVSVKAVERWMATPETGFPSPEWRLASGPVWRWTTVSAWSRKSGYPKPMFNAKEGTK